MCRVGEDEAVSKVQMIDKTECIIVKSLIVTYVGVIEIANYVTVMIHCNEVWLEP